jgi:formyltetrahydrofolate deformylase
MNEQSSVAVPSAAAPADQYVLTLSCPDKQGIVHAVSSYLFMTGCNIEDSQQFGDHDTGLFFMRVHFSADEPVTVDKLRGDR